MLVRLLTQVIKFTLQQRMKEEAVYRESYDDNKEKKLIEATHMQQIFITKLKCSYLDMLGEAVRASREPMAVPASSRSSSTFNSG